MSPPTVDSPMPGSDPFPRDSAAGPTTRRGRRPAVSGPPVMRVTAELAGGQSVTVSGPDLDLRRVMTLLTEVLSKARRAQSQQMSLATFISLLRDQAALAHSARSGG